MSKMNDSAEPRNAISSLADSLGAEVMSIETRLEKLRKTHIRTGRDEILSAAISRLVRRLVGAEQQRENSLRPIEGRILAVIGDSGAGKSWLLKRTLSGHPAFKGFDTPDGCPHAISISVRSPCTLVGLGREVLRNLGFENASGNADTVWSRVRFQFAKCDIRILIIDEFHDVVESANEIERLKIINSMRSLLNDAAHPIALILAGTPSVISGLADPYLQLSRRMEVVRLDPIDAGNSGADLHKGIALAAKNACLSLGQLPPDIAAKIILAAKGQLGRAAEIIVLSVEHSLERQSKTLELSDFAETFRRQAFATFLDNPFDPQPTTSSVTRPLKSYRRKDHGHVL